MIDISRYSRKTQERILAAVHVHRWWTAPGVTRHRVCLDCGLGQHFDSAEQMRRAPLN